MITDASSLIQVLTKNLQQRIKNMTLYPSGFIPGAQGWFHTGKSMNVFSSQEQAKKENQMTIYINAAKAQTKSNSHSQCAWGG